MKKLDMEAVLKYLVMGAGALFVPLLLNMVPQIGEFLSKIPMVGEPFFEGVSVLAVVIAGLGIGLIDQLFYQ